MPLLQSELLCGSHYVALHWLMYMKFDEVCFTIGSPKSVWTGRAKA